MSYSDLRVTDSITIGTSNQSTLTSVDMGMGSPILNVSGSMEVDHQLAVYGSVGSVSSDTTGAGGGAVIIGHGWLSSNDYPAIVLTNWPQGGSFNTAWLKHSIGGGPAPLDSLDWANLEVGKIIVTGGSVWYGGWNVVFDIQTGDGAIRCPTGNILFGLNYDGNFYWASIDTQTYTMILDHWGNLILSGSLYGYDEYDDLAIVKGITIRDIVQNGKTKKIIDLKTLGLVNPEETAQSRVAKTDLTNYYDVGKVQGFTLSCLKNVALKLSTHRTNYDALVNRLEALEKQLGNNA